MYRIQPEHGLSTLVNHAGEGNHPQHAHLSPIYQTSTFNFPDVDTGAEIIHDGPQRGYYYTRIANPNADQLAFKIALLEGLDLVRTTGEYSAFEPATMSGFAGAVEGRISGNEVFLTFKVDQETKGKKRLSDLEFKGVVKEEEGQVIINGWTTSNYEGSKKVMETLFTKESQTGE